MTNIDFYTFCRDQRKAESDPDRRDALTTVYDYMRECGVTKAGVSGFLDHCEQEAAKKRSPADGYQWLRRVFTGAAGPAPVAKTEEWKEGDRVTITVMGIIKQISESGVLVNAHGASIPVMKSDIIGAPGWTEQDLDHLAEITPADLAAASDLWDQSAPAKLKGLLGAEKDRDK